MNSYKYRKHVSCKNILLTEQKKTNQFYFIYSCCFCILLKIISHFSRIHAKAINNFEEVLQPKRKGDTQLN